MGVWSQISVSDLPGFRLDAEYYQPRNLELATTLAGVNPVAIGDIAFVTDGIHGSPDWVEDGGITYLSAKCVRAGYFELTQAGQISQEQNRLNPRTQARVGDVLVTTVGTIGNAAVVNEDVLPANMDRHLGIIRINNTSEVDPYYLASFLNSEFGRFQTWREATGNVQLALFIDKIKKLLVPVGHRYNKLGDLGRKAYIQRRESESLYGQAEAILASEIGLDKLSLSHQLTYERTFIEMQDAHRYDAEYFQPKYQRAMDLLSCSGQCVKDIANVVKRQFKAQNNAPFNYIEIGNLSDGGFTDSEELTGDEAPSRAQFIVQKNDVITSTVRPIRRLSALIEQKQDGYVCSSGFAVLEPQDIEPELLLVYLRLPIICEILDLFTAASMYPAISVSNLLNLPITVPSGTARQQIINKVRDSRRARHESKRLLEEAKRRVEEMILGGEM